MAGTVITVEWHESTPNINFLLKQLDLFSDGFESGDTIYWSVSEP